MVDISVIIVNYNVQALLEQTVLSVYKAASNLNIEIIVVDNHSADESCNMIRRRFKDVILIDNQENVGFSRANNQGIEIAKGQHVLILNPDTVLSEDSLSKTHQYLLTHIDVGALGVRMIDGRGTFLPESKRGLPTPMVAFYKMSGLAKLFPNSKRFGAYHLSYLNEFENHEVDVLSGAFMMIKKKVLDEVGYFDESFFMYGEDIDLSYRIQKAGYKNAYFSETTIIHYKGESTKKHSVNYVKIFYQAMAKFAKKHFSKQQGWWFSVCINLAIFLRAIIALINRTFSQLKLVAADYILTYLAYVGITRYWEHYNKFVIGGFYPDHYLYLHVPIYCLFWIGGIYISGGYQYKFDLSKSSRGIILGSVTLLTAYALLPENMRFSRALIVLGATLAFLISLFNRLVFHFLKYKHLNTNTSQLSQVVIIGEPEECERVKQILILYPNRFKLIGFIRPKSSNTTGDWMGHSEHLNDLIDLYQINEIIFCAKDIPGTEIMEMMSNSNNNHVKFKIMPEKGEFIIGSNSKNTSGEFYSVDITPALNNQETRNKKRMFDLIICFLLIPSALFILWNLKTFRLIYINWMACLIGKKTWVGYHPNVDIKKLPLLKPGVFKVGEHLTNINKDNQHINHLNLIYATNYNWQFDLNILVKEIFSNNFAK